VARVAGSQALHGGRQVRQQRRVQRRVPPEEVRPRDRAGRAVALSSSDIHSRQGAAVVERVHLLYCPGQTAQGVDLSETGGWTHGTMHLHILEHQRTGCIMVL